MSLMKAISDVLFKLQYIYEKTNISNYYHNHL